MVELLYRTVLIYFVVLVVVRLMGKREIGQLSPFDFVVAIIVAEIAAIPMQSPSVPLWHSMVPLAVLALLEIGLSFSALHSRKLRAFLDGRPQVVIEGGRILKEEMRRARYNLDDLLAQLREKGYPRPEDVEVAVLETSGRLSVVPKSSKRPVTPGDLGLSPACDGLPTVLVMDGEVFTEGLERRGLDLAWLEARLKEMGLQPKNVFLATLERDGRIFINGGGPAEKIKIGP
ncbi:MAG: DUF421 domain-containing protein [Peptococcaceae bacterium]|nr:DUF421 domain-containing protein [Peptococcaceae bacterium]